MAQVIAENLIEYKLDKNNFISLKQEEIGRSILLNIMTWL